MSAVPSTPLTSGRESAMHMRSSRVTRSAIAIGSSPARRAPRAGWSAAITMSLPPGPSHEDGRTRAAARSAITCGWLVRMSTSVRTSTARSDTAGLLESGEDLALGGHRRGALEPGGHDRAGDVGEAEHLLQRPPGEEPVAEGTSERVAGTEAVDHVDRVRRHLDRLVG